MPSFQVMQNDFAQDLEVSQQVLIHSPIQAIFIGGGMLWTFQVREIFEIGIVLNRG